LGSFTFPAEQAGKCNGINQNLLIFMGNNHPSVYKVIGLMSGTSLDGLDIAFCTFKKENDNWSWEIPQAETYPYSTEWRERLVGLETADAETFQRTHAEYGHYLGGKVADFIIKYDVRPDFISSHGHTIFHQPEKRFTVQVGAGTAIAAKCNLPVVFDFRTLDVARGGQGAPLVPIGDKLLFAGYDFCLNLGGFANISYEHRGQRIAYDVCPVNIVMNRIAEKAGKPFDDGGEMARSGMMSHYLLNEMNQLGFYKGGLHAPRSLGKEWVTKNIDPLLVQYELDLPDLLHTFAEHIAMQVARSIADLPKGKMLLSGGGAYNTYLVERIRALSGHEIILPEKRTIEFREALIFAFLGVLRMRNEVNCLKSVTGATVDSCGGLICQAG
jgi:anhydro-N-acetylmuramic acid kinase